MSFEPSISFIGSGNLAWHLALALDNKGYSVREVFSPTIDHAQALADRLYNAQVNDTLDFSNSNSRIFIMAVADAAIESVAQEIILPDGSLLIHTSGSIGLEALNFAAPAAAGVFYPLQSFSKNRKAEFKGLPIFVESNDEDAEEILFEMGRSLGGNIQKISTEQRAALHVAATFASNFTNHMLTLASQFSEKHEIPFHWLKPLIRETIEKSLVLGPFEAQTGPAKRGDLPVLDKHLELLQDDEKVAEIYRIISQSILDTHQPD
jgi:predicted short-subunit dehydrogenase-like oxidoreductase (DUF2520 family)